MDHSACTVAMLWEMQTAKDQSLDCGTSADPFPFDFVSRTGKSSQGTFPSFLEREGKDFSRTIGRVGTLVDHHVQTHHASNDPMIVKVTEVRSCNSKPENWKHFYLNTRVDVNIIFTSQIMAVKVKHAFASVFQHSVGLSHALKCLPMSCIMERSAFPTPTKWQ
jgi:hypothetical protein